jgi:hypothetical protein
VIADLRSSQQSSAAPPGPAVQAARCTAKSFHRNILHVSTFTSKILRCSAQLQALELKDLHPAGISFQITQNAPLTPTLS